MMRCRPVSNQRLMAGSRHRHQKRAGREPCSSHVVSSSSPILVGFGSRRQRVSAPRTASLPRLGPHVGAGLAAGISVHADTITLAYHYGAVINFP